MTDVYPSNIAVHSGRHSALPQPGSSLQQTIASLLVLPDQDVDMAVYTDKFYRDEYHAVELVGEAETARLLREALDFRSGAIRSHACLALAEVFRDKTCLAALIRDSAAPAADRERARGLAENKIMDAR